MTDEELIRVALKDYGCFAETYTDIESIKLQEKALEALDRIKLERASYVAELSRLKCKCDMRTKLVGDGCQYCNPRLAEELKGDSDDS